MSAVGSLREEIAPSQMVVPDQLIDRTRNRNNTFFGRGLVAHIAFDEPFCPVLSETLAAAAEAPVSVDPAPGGPGVPEPDPVPVNPAAHLAPGETLLVKGVPKPAEEPEPEPDEPPATEVSPENAKLGEAMATPDVLKAAEDIFAKTSDDAAKDAADDVEES